LIIDRPDTPDVNLWDLLIHYDATITANEKSVRSLKSLIQAPDNGFLVVDILTKFLQLRNCFSKPSHINHGLNAHFKTAELILLIGKSFFSEYWHCNLTSYIDKVKSHNGQNFALDDLTFFEEQRLFNRKSGTNYKTKHRFYVTLFYPHHAQDIKVDTAAGYMLAASTLNRLKAYAFNLLSNTSGVIEEKLISYLYNGFRGIISKDSFEHLLLNNPRFASLSEINLTLNSKISSLEAMLENPEQILAFAMRRKTFMGASIKQTEDQIKLFCEGLINNKLNKLRLFFIYFDPADKALLKQSDNQKRSVHREKYNLRLGSVILEGQEDKHISLNYEVIQSTRIKGISSIAGNVDIDDEPNESIGQILTVDEEKPCQSKSVMVKVMSAKQKNHHIALHNQYLLTGASPRIQRYWFDWSCQKLTEFNQILANNTMPSTTDQANTKYAIGILVLLMTGRGIKEVHFLERSLVDTGGNAVTFFDQGARIALPYPNYVYQSVRISPLFINALSDKVELLLPKRLRELMSPIWQFFIDKQQHVVTIPTLMSLKDEQETKINLKHLADSVFRSLYKYANGDLWLTSLFTGNPVGLSKTQRHYASCNLTVVQKTFLQHLSQFIDAPLIRGKEEPQRVGSQFYLDEAVFAEFICQLHTLISVKQRPLATDILSKEDIVRLFNLLSFYTDILIAFSTGMRNVVDPFVPTDEVSLKGWCYINDKNLFDGYNTRFCYLPEVVRTQLQRYLALRDIFIRRLTDRGRLDGSVKVKGTKKDIGRIATNNQLLLLTFDANQTGKVNYCTLIPYTRTPAFACVTEALVYFKTPILFNLLELKTNMNRHYLRGKLFDLGVSPSYIDAYMGHFNLGSEPWGMRSMFNQNQYQQQLGDAINKIAQLLNFQPTDVVEPKVFQNKAKKNGVRLNDT
jgi:hypothetical protein